MALINEIKNWLIRAFIVLVSFLFFTLSSISVLANSISHEQACRSYSSVDLKISEKQTVSTNQNVKETTTARQFLGVEYANFTSAARNAAKTGTEALVTTGNQWSKHSLQRLAERGVTQKMAETAISKGQKFYDPLNKSINYVLPNGFASGKSLLVGTNPLTGQVTTVLRSSKNLINSRFIPIK